VRCLLETQTLGLAEERQPTRRVGVIPLQGLPPQRPGRPRFRTMTLAPDEFIRRFLLHVLANGFHRIRRYGLLASAGCKTNIVRARELIAVPVPVIDPPAEHDDPDLTASAAAEHRPPCPCCGGRMIIVEFFERGGAPRGPPSSQAGVRTATP
jgi:hypothetical protein